MPLQLKMALKQMNGKRIFPVHTECAELFSGFMRDVKSEAAIVEKNKEYTL